MVSRRSISNLVAFMSANGIIATSECRQCGEPSGQHIVCTRCQLANLAGFLAEPNDDTTPEEAA